MKLNDLKNIGSRSSFVETWLNEMPMGLGSFETYDALEYTIKDFLKHKIEPVKTGNLYKIDAGNKLFYWFGTSSVIDLATELHVKPEGLVVSLTGKNPRLKGKPPFASDLYASILKDSDDNIKLMSDDQLSDEGFGIWKKLIAKGFKISVYDIKEPGKSFQSFANSAELDKFFRSDDSDFRRYRYVLSENVMSYVSMRASFRLRLLRESTPGMALTDYAS